MFLDFLILTTLINHFGRNVVVFNGDFRQILPVILKVGRQDTMHAIINSSYSRDYCKVLKFTKNMRLLTGSYEASTLEIKDFSKQILNLVMVMLVNQMIER